MYRILPLFTLNLLDFTHFYQKSTSFFGFQKFNRSAPQRRAGETDHEVRQVGVGARDVTVRA